ncbi:MAG: putative sugar nucleotidyl transferase [Salibacteraceae bacterium]
MNVILFDGSFWQNLLPITYTRPCSEIRCGITTISEKWNIDLGCQASFATRKYLSEKYAAAVESENCFVAGNTLPDKDLAEVINSLGLNEALTYQSNVISFKVDKEQAEECLKLISKGQDLPINKFKSIEYNGELKSIEASWDIFQETGDEISADIARLGLKANKETIEKENTLFGSEIFIEEGAKVRGAILNSESGPIHIGKDAEVMEGSVIRGPFTLGEHSTIKMSSKVYGPTTIGPHCKVGGEVTNIVMFAYSNKGHDGFIGNSVIGEWCNFGADTNSSNLKNNYSPVRVWSYPNEKMEETGLQFCGLIAGDHCKTGINTMLNTGTVLGVCSNVFGGGFPPKFIPSFSWGGEKGFDTFRLDKAFEVGEAMMNRRKLTLTSDDRKILQHIFLSDALYR